MTIFVGGRLHGQDIDVLPVPQTALETATDQPAVPSPSYVDIATGETYLLRPVGLNLNNVQTGQLVSQWEATVYAHETVAGNPQSVMEGVNHAVIGWWFTTRGTRKRSTQASNGKAAVPGVWYVARCQGCHPVLPMPFATSGDRAKWIVAHTEATGHEVKWSDEQREGKAAT